MLFIDEFAYSEEYNCYFATAMIEGIEFAILYEESEGDVTILKRYDVSEEDMEEVVEPYSELILIFVAKHFGAL